MKIGTSVTSVTAVLGLGESLSEFIPSPDIQTMGVNDIWSKFPAASIVCIDPKRVFTPERLSVIRNSKPIKFFSQLPEWEDNFGKAFELIEFQKPRGSLLKLDESNKVCYSFCSPYVACVLAYKMGAEEITMHGCDFNSHKVLSQPYKQAIIKRDFINLYNELKRRGVRLFVGSKKSFLAGFMPTKLDK